MAGTGIDWDDAAGHIHIVCWRCGNKFTVPIPHREGDPKRYLSIHGSEVPTWVVRRLGGFIRNMVCPHCEAHMDLELVAHPPTTYSMGVVPLEDDGLPWELMGG